MPTTNETLNALGRAAVTIATQAAREYLQRLHAVPADGLGKMVQDEVLGALDGALTDAQEALDCGMVEAGCQTFAASMALAGIAAAKRALAPAEPHRTDASMALTPLEQASLTERRG